jgi:ribosome biogenesis GTPase
MQVYSLNALGWSDFFAAQWNEPHDPELSPARVAEENRSLYYLFCENGECWAELRGKLRHNAASPAALPAVGDWVLAQQHGSRGTIHHLFERRSKFSRKVAGKKTEEQIVVANVDTVLLVSSLNREFNPRRIERYLTLAWESGARPIVVLNKSDLCVDISTLACDADAAAMGVPVVITSALQGDGLAELREIVRTGGTTALLGSSGVGKSSLINALLGRELQPTREVREADDRGRHATTSRQLILLPGGGLLIDTPGMRELQLWDTGDGLEQSFADIQELAGRCRFRDCSHTSEPGCAVIAGIDAARLASFHKLAREQRFIESKQDAALRSEQTKAIKRIMKGQRRLYRSRDRGR